MVKKWWKEANVYQIYPRSFMDSNGDGIGDLCGIIQKLDYIKELGIDVIWLSPVYKSPNADNGYDISDYQDIMDEFGTLEDFDRLVAEAKARGLKIVMDLVVNHSSDEHKWFTESRKKEKNPYSDYYIWRDQPNNWGAAFSTGSAWTYVPERGQYYLHLFTPKQPDLNWECEAMREDVYKMMRWWMDRGVAGFRMDVICDISKDQRFPDGKVPPGGKYGDHGPYTTFGPRLHEFLKEMNREALSKYDVFTVGETWNCTPEEYLKLCGEDAQEISMSFPFEHMQIRCGAQGKWSNKEVPLRLVKDIFNKWQTRVNGKGWNTLVWSNHDVPRPVSYYGDDTVYWKESAKMLAMAQYLMQGTVYVYQGEELGMKNVDFTDISSFRDVESLGAYRELQENDGWSPEKAFRQMAMVSRDNARTPMQWDGSENAGFTTGTPWIPVIGNYKELNAAAEQEDPDSILHFYQKLLHLKKGSETLIYGDYRMITDTPEDVYAYSRKLDGEEIVVICNLCREEQKYDLPEGARLISNYSDETKGVLRPFESVAIRVK